MYILPFTLKLSEASCFDFIVNMKSDFKFLVPLSLGVVILNTIAIYVVVKTKVERRKSSTLILVSLLVGDILIGAVVIPARLIEIHLLKSSAFPYIYAYILFVAAFNVAFLTWERYVSITKPLWRRRIGNGKMITILVINWTLPAFISLIPLCWEYSKIRILITKIYRYVLVTILMSIVATVVVFQVLVLRGLFIFWKGKRQGKQRVLTKASRHGSSNQSFRKKLTSMFLVIAVTMSTIATWLPTIILNFRPDLVTTWVTKMSLYSFFVNSLVDPIIILLFNFNLCLRLLRQKREKRSTKEMKGKTRSAESSNCRMKMKEIDKEKRTENTFIKSI